MAYGVLGAFIESHAVDPEDHASHRALLVLPTAQKRKESLWQGSTLNPKLLLTESNFEPSNSHASHYSPKPELQILSFNTITLGIKIAQKPYIVRSLGAKALMYESLDP